jgi:phage terminase large subunit-like protein
MSKVQTEVQKAREQKKLRALKDFEYFIELVQPKRLLGNIHKEVISWWTRQDAKNHQLLLLPRDHGKSAMIALRVVWELTKDPTLRVLYISSTSNLAIKQLKFIKDVFTSPSYRLYWPEMVNEDEAKREKWTEREIALDHPKRREESIRDPSVFTAGLTTNIVGMHCDIAVLDDVVVAANAYVQATREKVKEQYGYLSSIEGANAREWVVGTRYHPNDLYSDLIGMMVERYDENGDKIAEESLFEVKQHEVESAGDGTGEFLWPKQQRSDGKWFGFDSQILADKKSKYTNRIHFRAQYYNDPQDIESSPIQRDLFQYYDPNFLVRANGKWQFRGEPLNVVAAVDFAYSLGAKSDYTSIVVVGVDGNNNYYILEIDRFKTDRISEYYNHILKLYEKWGFRKLRAEVSVAQKVIVQDIRDNYIRPHGLSLTVDEYHPTRWLGSKEERIMATLEPKYANRQIWHYRSGNCQTLEEELIFANPAHDDVKDALASAIDYAVAPLNIFRMNRTYTNEIKFNSRWGGVA